VTGHKTVCPMLSDHCLSVCPAFPFCDVRALWPNGWTDQDETWQAGRPWPWPHCVRWGPSSPSSKGAHPPFSAHISCGQMAAWIKMSLRTELGLSPGDFVLDGNPAPPPPKGHTPIFGPYLLRPNGCMDQDVTWYGARTQPRRLCVRWEPRSPTQKGAEPTNFRPMFIVAKRLDG